MATIFGITGTIGAGKGTVVEYLKQKGFLHYSARGFLIEEIGRRGLPVNRDSMNTVGESLRAEHGASYVIDTLYEQAKRSGGDAIIESVRTMGEVESLKSKNAFLIAVDAEARTRWQRVVKRASETDAVSFEKFVADEARESVSDDPARMNLVACMKAADFTVMNDGSVEELDRQVAGILARVGRS